MTRLTDPARALLGAMLLFAPATARAQDDDAPVVVTATRDSARRAVPESVAILSADQIRATPAKSLDDILRTVPSVNLPAASSSMINPALNTASMRGLGGSRALILLDGVPLNDPFFGYVQWSQLPLESIDRVEVVRGGNSALWGNYAMGGVINVISRAPDAQRFTLSGGAGSQGLWRGDGHAAIRPSDALGLSVSASAYHSDGYITVRPQDKGAITVPSKFDAFSTRAALRVDLGSATSASLWSSYHQTAQTLRTPRNTNRQRLWYLGGDITHDFGTSALTATAFRVGSHYVIANVDTPPGVAVGTAEYVQNRHITPATNAGASLTWSLRGEGVLRLLSIGGDYQAISGSDLGLIYSPASAVIRTDTGRGRQSFAGAFVQVNLAPLDGLDLLASGRYQYFRNHDGYDGSPTRLGAVPPSHATSFDPRISLRYAVSPHLAVRAGANRAFRAPSLNALYRSFTTRIAVVKSNAALKPETMTSWEAGVDVTLPWLRVQASYYDSRVRDLITTRRLVAGELPAGFVAGTLAINAGRARARGVEADASLRFTPRLSATLGYAFADSIITANPNEPASVGLQLGGVPRHSASARVDYKVAGRWQAGTRLRWHARYYSDNLQRLPIDEQCVVDVSASVRLSPRIEAFGQVENLFDQMRIVDNSGNSVAQLGTPRTAYTGLRLGF